MKLTKSAIALALLSSFSLSAAAADVVIYGKVNVTFQYSDDKEEGNRFTEVKSNASRIGFKGDHSINDDLMVVYQAEFQVDIDGDDDNFTERTQFLGLQGNFGKVYLGKMDTMLKQSQGKVDLFNDLETDIKVLWTGENRSSNVLAYMSPSFGGFKFGATYLAEEQTNDDRGYSVAAFYGDANLKKSKFYASLAHDSNVEGETRAFGEKGSYDTTRATVQTKVAGVKLGAIYHTQEDVETGAELDGYMVSASYAIDQWTLKGQYQVADMKGVEEKTGYSIGADYRLAKPTKAFVFYSAIDSDNSDDKEWLGVGLEHKF
ncbi:porin [Thalassotalea sp. LPB0316]|uniref:porin n=1 Tax=Thalassotalea sp. LPB0316 TaxID=2769490 RepID=UPI001865E10D|nr:porin [Thalassotalea sp. LPB0316]QOL27011.1 porin [Thalassotalea sp. LPB0316]